MAESAGEREIRAGDERGEDVWEGGMGGEMGGRGSSYWLLVSG